MSHADMLIMNVQEEQCSAPHQVRLVAVNPREFSAHQLPQLPDTSGDVHTNGESGELGSGIVSRGVLTSFSLSTKSDSSVLTSYLN